MNKHTYTLYVDLDGVLCDFLRAVSFLVGHKLETHSDWEAIRLQAWEILSGHGHAFWSTLPWTDDGKELWEYVKKHSPSILSAYPTAQQNREYAIEGKQRWIKQELTDYSKVHLVPGREKQFYACPTCVLIDDSIRNINQFRERGGIGILHVKTSITITELKRYGL